MKTRCSRLRSWFWIRNWALCKVFKNCSKTNAKRTLILRSKLLSYKSNNCSSSRSCGRRALWTRASKMISKSWWARWSNWMLITKCARIRRASWLRRISNWTISLIPKIKWSKRWSRKSPVLSKKWSKISRWWRILRKTTTEWDRTYWIRRQKSRNWETSCWKQIRLTKVN